MRLQMGKAEIYGGHGMTDMDKLMVLRGTLEGIRPYLEGWASANVRTNFDKSKKARARTLLDEINAILDAAETE